MGHPGERPYQGGKRRSHSFVIHFSSLASLVFVEFNQDVGWRRISIIGVGLLGGSLGLAIKRRGLAQEVVAYVRRSSGIDACLKYQAADRVTRDIREATVEADLIVLCTPISQMGELARAMGGGLSPGALVTDVGSVKGPIMEELEPVIRESGAVFVGSHPMAGSEKSGLAAASASLFEQATCAITPSSATPQYSLDQAEAFWKGVGASPLIIPPELHDELVGRCSHLPHVVASALTQIVLGPSRAKEQLQLCGSGFRDTTRIASGSPEMWYDIVRANRRHLSRELEGFIEKLQEFRVSLDAGREQEVYGFLASARDLRDAWLEGDASP